VTSSQDREPLRPPVTVPGTWAHRVSVSPVLPAVLAVLFALLAIGGVLTGSRDHAWWRVAVAVGVGGDACILGVRAWQLRRARAARTTAR
jgi:peptidoglycan/LPS O-acetylase OafA/YrhL